MNTINHWTEILHFANEEKEALFGRRSQPGIQLRDVSRPKASKHKPITVSMRVDSRMLARIKRCARMRSFNYHNMIHQWLRERMEEESI